jgi:predicted dithiol-disulfide oxidoreductase (DUF899 family)
MIKFIILIQVKFYLILAWSRGIDILNGAYNYIDLLPYGRNEKQLKFSMGWLNYKENYSKD